MKFKDETYALLRIVTGFLFMPHGYQKFFGLGDKGPREEPMVMVAAIIELVGGAMIMVGFQTRWVAFLCSGLMAAAYFIAHGLRTFLPILNGGELAVLYCFVFLMLWANGSGCWSVDKCLADRRKA